MFTHCPFYVQQELSKLWSTPAQPSLPAFEVSVKDASPSNTSSVRSKTGSKEATSAKVSCPFPNCGKGYRRLQELERHIREAHLSHDNYCEQPGCNWTGYRRYSHLASEHAGVLIPEEVEYIIYDAKGLVKRILSKEINVEQAVDEAQWSFQTKAVELGKLGIWKGTTPPEL